MPHAELDRNAAPAGAPSTAKLLVLLLAFAWGFNWIAAAIALHEIPPWSMRFAGSGIGGLPETQEMLDFCAEHNIVCDIETIAIQQINEAYERMLKADVKYRFVIDMASLKA